MSRPLPRLLAVVGLLLALLALPATAQEDPTVERLAADSDVAAAAIAMSQRTFDSPGSADYIVLGRDDAFPDNLAATALAGTRGPLLYTTGGPDAALRADVRDEIERLIPPFDQPCTTADAELGYEVYIVGGTSAVSAAAEQELIDANYCVLRIGGASRYETARRIADQVVALSQRDLQVLVARADDWADAATGGAYAAFAGVPVIVTDTGALHPEAEDFLAALASRRGTGTGVSPRAYILGGPAAISFEVEDEIAAYVDTTRVAGAARDLTALAVRTQLWHLDAADGLMIVPGYDEDGWAYAFAAAAFAGQLGTPQVYTQPDVLNGFTCEALAEQPLSYVGVVGPTSVISAGVQQEATGAVNGLGCDGEAPDMPEDLAVVVDQYLAPEGVEPGVWVARTDGTGLRRIATGTYFGTPAWHPDGDRLAVIRETGDHDVVDLIHLDGRAPTTLLGPEEMQDGEFITRVGFNPRVTEVDEIAVALTQVIDGAESHRSIAIHSPKGGRLTVSSGSGSASMSAEPYSPDGRLTFVDTGEVVYEDPEQPLTFHPLAQSLAFGEAEWGPSGQIAFDTTGGVAVFEPGANGDPFLLQPYGYATLDWFPPAADATGDRLVYGSDDESTSIAYTYDLGPGGGSGGAYQGGSPDVSPDGQYVAVTGPEGLSVVVHPRGFGAMTTEIPLPASGFAYPPWYTAGG